MKMLTASLAYSFAVCLLLIAGLVPAGRALAQDNADIAVETEGPEHEPGLFLLGGKVGGIAPFNGLDPFLHGAVELGYVFPVLDQGLGAYLQVEYSAPSAEGHVDETFDQERVPSGGYDWEINQKELVLAPTFLYRMTSLSDWLTPYVGLAFRLYLLEDTVTGKAGDETFDETKESSTKYGLGLPVGAEFAAGPGGITAELMLQWGPLDHTLTGDTHLGGASLFVGYRLLLRGLLVQGSGQSERSSIVEPGANA